MLRCRRSPREFPLLFFLLHQCTMRLVLQSSDIKIYSTIYAQTRTTIYAPHDTILLQNSRKTCEPGFVTHAVSLTSVTQPIPRIYV